MKRIYFFLLFLSIFVSSCVSIPKIQEGINYLDDSWKIANKNILKTLGTKTYKISKKKAFQAATIASTELGFIIENQDLDSGYLYLTARAPTPLTQAEWNEIKAREEPIMQESLAPRIGDFHAALIGLNASSFESLVNVLILEREKDVKILMKFRMKYIAPEASLVHGDQPPPTAVKKALQKWWDTFDRSLFIQERTFK
ncbi:hypothetical protein ACQZV8_06580 [Magnetococcales bacterium HHB-1]